MFKNLLNIVVGTLVIWMKSLTRKLETKFSVLMYSLTSNEILNFIILRKFFIKFLILSVDN